MRACGKCGETDSAKFYPSSYANGGWCKRCVRAYYNAKDDSGFSRQSKHTRVHRHRKRDELSDLKVARGCEKCGIKHPAVLSFHHRDGQDKKFTISQARLRLGREALLQEVSKCDVLCENCHRIAHWEALHRPDPEQ
jgi:hypothetical protein